MFTEQFVVIYDELLVSFGLALVAVLALSLLVLGKVAVVLLVCLTVVSNESRSDLLLMMLSALLPVGFGFVQ